MTIEQEVNADLIGTEYLWNAGYDYKGILNFLKRRNRNAEKEIRNNFCRRSE